MIQKAHFTLLFCLMIGFSSTAQKYGVYRKKQMFLGISGGINFSLPTVTGKFHVLEPTDKGGFVSDKKYDNLFRNSGSQFAVHWMYSFSHHLSLTVQPGYQTNGMNYFSSFAWSDSTENSGFKRELHHRQKFSYITLPVLIRWDFTLNQFSPYVKFGVQADFRHQGSKVIRYDNTIDQAETKSQLFVTNEAGIKEHMNRFNIGVVAGFGVTYFTKYAAFGIETNVNFRFLKIIDDETRFADYSGFTMQYLDVFDQFMLPTLNLQLTAKVPITRALTLNILRKKRY